MMQELAARMGSGRRESVEARAAAAAERVARRAAVQSPGVTITRVAVSSEIAAGYEICTRAFYEEGCSESEFICEAYAVQDERGEVHSSVET